MQNSKPLSSNIQVMIKACHRGSAAIARDFIELEQLQSSRRDLGEFSKIVDQKAAKAIVGELRKSRPDYGIWGEDLEEVDGQGKYRWVIDPIDGTSNFVHAHPNYAISIALEKLGILQVNRSLVGYVVAAIVYLPYTKEIYWAEKDKGAYHINPQGYQTKLKVSAGGYQTVGTIMIRKPSDYYENTLKEIRKIGGKIRVSGSIAMDLAYVASGRLDHMFIERFNIWDIAAGHLLVTEAGGCATYTDGIFFAGNNDFIMSLEKICKEKMLVRNLDLITKVLASNE